jgi:hypothetical protein
LKGGEAIGVLEEDLGRDEVLYVHQLLQEYFAARRLAENPQLGRVEVAWESERVSPSLEETSSTSPTPIPCRPCPAPAGRRPP